MRPWSTAWQLLLATGISLGLSLPLGRLMGAAGVPALTTALLLSCGVVLLLFPLLLAAGGARLPDRARLRFFAVSALLSYTMPNLIVFTVIPKLGAGYTGIMFALSPICTLLLATALGLRRPTLLAIAGLAAGCLGALFVAVTRGGVETQAPLWLVGLALGLPVSLAAGNVYRTLYWPSGAGPFELAVGSHAAAALILATLSVPLMGGPHLDMLARVPWPAMALVASAAAMFAVYFRLQQVGGPIYLSQISYVAAAVGLAFGTLAFGEVYPVGAWVGAAMIVAGVVMTTLGQRG